MSTVLDESDWCGRVALSKHADRSVQASGQPLPSRTSVDVCVRVGGNIDVCVKPLHTSQRATDSGTFHCGTVKLRNVRVIARCHCCCGRCRQHCGSKNVHTPSLPASLPQCDSAPSRYYSAWLPLRSVHAALRSWVCW